MTYYLLSLYCRLMALIGGIVAAGWIAHTSYVWTLWHTGVAVLAFAVVALSVWMGRRCPPPWAQRSTS